jgi:L-ascorbate metabolism protein UlaG (beta-lactamase superfamily)
MYFDTWNKQERQMKLRLIRHATLQIELAGRHLLIDPMFAEPGAYCSLTLGTSAARNPIVPMPCSTETLLQPDMIIVTHSHFDHFDSAARKLLPKHLPLICQPADRKRFQSFGFTQAISVDSSPVDMGDLQFIRTKGKHGQGIIGQAMGHVSGFVITASHEPRLYIAGDTIWGPDVQDVLDSFHPDIVVLNAGAARFNAGDPITMTADDVIKVCRAAPRAKITAVHMEAVNHCRLKRAELTDRLRKAGAAHQVSVLADGEFLMD